MDEGEVGGTGDGGQVRVLLSPLSSSPHSPGLSHGHTTRAQGSHPAMEHRSPEHLTKSITVSRHTPRIWLHQSHEVVPFGGMAASQRRL